MIRRLHLAPAWLAASIGLGSIPTASAQGDRPGPPGYVLTVTGAKRIHDELTFGDETPRFVADEWVVHVCRLPELPGQVAVRSAMAPAGQPCVDLSPLSRPLLMTRVTARELGRQNGVTVRVEYDATLLVRSLERREPGSPPPPAVEPPSPRERRGALAAGHHFDFEAPGFRRWLEDRGLRRKPGEGDVDFGRRVFLEIKEKCHYAYADRADRSASSVCQAGQSDAGGLSILLVSALRANGVPARVLAGRWAFPSSGGKNAADEVYVRAEFFASGVGWVPVDIGSALRLDKSKEGLAYFGQDRGDFLTLHVDTDVEIDTVFSGPKTLETLQNPAFWASGSGSLDGSKFPASSKIRVEDVDPVAAQRRTTAMARSPAPASRKNAPAASRPAEIPGRVTASGVVIEKQEGWIKVRVDGEDQPVKYILGEKADMALKLDWPRVFAVARVRLISREDTDPRELIAIARAPSRPAGTITGEVVEAHGWWVEVRPKDGPADGFAVHFSGEKAEARARLANDAMLERVKDLKPGDVVTIRYTTDSERHRIETLRKKDEPGR